MDVTPELISLYVDNALPAAEAREVEEAIAGDPALNAEYEELRALDELFGTGEGEPLPPELRSRLNALRPIPVLDRFEQRPVAPVRRIRWTTIAAAAATVLLAIIGVRTLSYKPEVTLRDFTRMALDTAGQVAGPVETSRELVRRSGDRISTGPLERISFRGAKEVMVVLLPGSSLRVGDPRDRELFKLDQGTVLCTVRRAPEGAAHVVEAAGFRLHVFQADFGVRIVGRERRAAGLSDPGGPQVIVTVSRGSLEVGRNGDRRVVDAYERIELDRSGPGRLSAAYLDPTYPELMRSFRLQPREVAGGYFASERGVMLIDRRRWIGSAARRVLVLTDGEREAPRARYLVLEVHVDRRTALRVVRVTPYRKRPGLARTTTFETAALGPGWAVTAIPLEAFSGPAARTAERKIPVDRSRLMRLEVAPADRKARFALKTSLWAERPPMDNSLEVDR